VTFAYQATGSPGRDDIVVFRDWDYPGYFDEDGADIWTSAEISLGTTVRFERTPDIADDRRLTYGTVRLTRSGPTNTDLTATVAAETSTTYLLLPATPGVHYELRTSSGTNIPMNPDSTWQVTIPAGAREVTVRVQPKPGFGDAAEFRAAYLNIAPPVSDYAAAPPGPWVTTYPHAYQTGNNPPAVISISDGPRYRLYELTDFYGGGGGASGFTSAAGGQAEAAGAPAEGTEAGVTVAEEQEPAAAGTSPPAEGQDFGSAGSLPGELMSPPPTNVWAYATWAYAINQPTNASIAGYATYYTNGYYFSLGDTWVAPNYTDLIYIGGLSGSPLILGVDDAGNVVGKCNNQACYVPAGCTNLSDVVTLQSITPGRPGEALWLAPTSGKPVGWSSYRPGSTDYARPTRWEKVGTNWQTVDLLSFDGNPSTPGYAYMANDSGVTVGKSRVSVGSALAWRAFRTVPSQNSNRLVSTNLNALGLSVNTIVVTSLTNNVANGVNSTGDAVGATDCWYNRGGVWKNETRAAIWWPGSFWTTNAAVLGTVAPYGYFLASSRTPGRSEALAVNRTAGGVTVVGTSWTTPTGSPAAFVMDIYSSDWWTDWWATYSLMLNLNDPHLTYMASGWVLSTAEAINDQGWIVGNGYYDGSARAFLLVPQDVLLHGNESEE